MNPQNRQTVAEIAIGLVICFAAAELLLLPARRELREQRAAIAGMLPASSSVKAPEERDVARLAEANERGRREIVLRSAASKDEAALFAEIMAIADRQRIRVDQFEPGSAGAASSAKSSGQSDEQARPDIVATYNVSLSGGYAGIVRFLDELRRSKVFVNARSARISPTDTDSTNSVRAELLVEFYGFNIPTDDGDASAHPEVTP